MAEAKVNRKSAVDGRRFFLDHNEAEFVDRPDGKPLMKGRVRVMSMAPLMERARSAEANEGAPTEPPSNGTPTEPQQNEGAPTELSRVRSGQPGVRFDPSVSALTEPNTEGDGKETEPDTETGAREARASGLSPSSSHLAAPPRAHLEAERRADEAELASLRAQLDTTAHPEQTKRAIESIEARLGHLGEPV
jgi:hypothetical protein